MLISLQRLQAMPGLNWIQRQLTAFCLDRKLIHEEDSFYECLGNEVKNDNNKSFKTLDDVLNDDTVLFSDWDNMDITKTKLFQTEKVTRKKRVVNGKIAARQKVAKFDEYKIKFQQVQRELASGQRKLLPFKNYEINLHQYYVLKGQLIYMADCNK